MTDLSEAVLLKEGISEEGLFDSLMEKIGNDGKFQRRFNLIFNFIMVALASMPYLNLVLALNIPEHHCHVPGREKTNLTLVEWQRKTIPMDVNPHTNVQTMSSCKMFNSSEKDIVDCQFGWDYDTQWYGKTAPVQENWVCDRELYVTNAFVASRIGELMGIFVFGQLGDIIGRKPVFYITITILLIGRVITAFTAHYYYVFLAAVVIGSTATVSVFQSPMVICMEVSSERKRAQYSFIQCAAWVIGCCAMPIIAWAIKNWSFFLLMSTLPSTFGLFLWKLMPESPRWLASKGRVRESLQVLNYIARVNGTYVPSNAESVLQKIADKKEKVYGIPSLFSHPRLAKNSIAIIVCWTVCGLSYYSLVLNVSNMSGNPVMNFFWQSLVELPGYILGRFVTNRFGRRWTQICTFSAAVLLYLCVILSHGSASWVTTTFVTLAKMSTTVSFFIMFLQAVEMYPTCLRQTGTSVGGLVANIFGILGPYIVYLGTSVDVRLPYAILLGLAFLGGTFAFFLPETLNKKLPETLEDAIAFGRDQKYFSFNRSTKRNDLKSKG